ncbi:MAG TPA: hypothetical protein VE988_18595 [Gemmataceae bacterium]|nr:hypothetical protein [Gemmataceae bacterium]
MDTPLLSLSLCSKRDLLRARQMARHAVNMLGYDARQQILLTAAVFDLVCQVHAQTDNATLDFDIINDHFHVVCTPGRPAARGVGSADGEPVKLNKPLPAGATVPRADVPWMLQKLLEMAPLDVFDEMRKINQELLQTLLDQGRQRNVPANQPKPNVA